VSRRSAGFRQSRNEHFADLVDSRIQVVIEVNKRVEPDSLLQFLTRDHVAGTLQKNGEDLEWLTCKFQPDTVFPQLPGPRINLESPESNWGCCMQGFSKAAEPRWQVAGVWHFNTKPEVAAPSSIFATGSPSLAPSNPPKSLKTPAKGTMSEMIP